MTEETGEERLERLKRFIGTMKTRRCDTLITPLEEKIQSYRKGEAAPEDVFKTAGWVGREGKGIEGDFKKRPEVILAGIAMDQNRYITEIGEISVKLRPGDITSVFTDAVVNPASPDGAMAAGVAKALKAAGGEEIEREAVARAPIAPGTAVVTGAGALPNLHVVHAPTAADPGGATTVESAKAAVAAALAAADSIECETIAVSGMGTGTGGLPFAEAARAVIGALEDFTPKNLFDVILIDRSGEMVEAFEKALEEYDEEHE